MKFLYTVALFFLFNVCTNAQGQIFEWISHDVTEIKQVNGAINIRLKVTSAPKNAKFDVLVNGKSINVGRKADEVKISKGKIFKERVPIKDKGYVGIVVTMKTRNKLYKSKTLVVLNGTAEKPRLFLLSIGATPPGVDYTVEDANDFYAAFSRQACGKNSLYREVINGKLTGGKATRNKIFTGLRGINKWHSVSPMDVVILFISSHGMNIDGNFYIQPTDYEAGVEETYIDMNRVYDILDKIDAKKILFIDACESGNKEKTYGASPHPDPVKTIQETRPGYTIITSSTGTTSSYSLPKWKNGAFTEALIEGLSKEADADANEDKIITLSEIFTYVSKRVPKLTDIPKIPEIQRPDTVSFELGDLPFFMSDKFCETLNSSEEDYYPASQLYEGKFEMGSPRGEHLKRQDNEKIQSKTIERANNRDSLNKAAFQIGLFEVTNKQYCVFLNDYVDTKGRKFKGNKIKDGAGNILYDLKYGWREIVVTPTRDEIFKPKTGYENHPVVCVSWYGARAYVKWLSEKDYEYKYSLPTEAEWEYAAQGGADITSKKKRTVYSDVENERGAKVITDREGTIDVNTTKSNRNYADKQAPKGMTANVSEWCESPYRFPGDIKGARVVKGGNFNSKAHECRIAYKMGKFPDHLAENLGFRMIRVKKTDDCTTTPMW